MSEQTPCSCGGGYYVLGSTDGHRADCPSHRRSALVTCPHEWTDRGVPGCEWRECWLCGQVWEDADDSVARMTANPTGPSDLRCSKCGNYPDTPGHHYGCEEVQNQGDSLRACCGQPSERHCL